jgi:hypothetical protein
MPQVGKQNWFFFLRNPEDIVLTWGLSKFLARTSGLKNPDQDFSIQTPKIDPVRKLSLNITPEYAKSNFSEADVIFLAPFQNQHPRMTSENNEKHCDKKTNQQ